MTDLNFTITYKEKGNSKIWGLPFSKAKMAILGNKYELSLVFISAKESKKLNLTYRGKNKLANVLSFPFNKKSGEIFISTKASTKDAKNFQMNHKNFIFYLFIHGTLHLKGLNHGKKMDILEKKFLGNFGIK